MKVSHIIKSQRYTYCCSFLFVQCIQAQTLEVAIAPPYCLLEQRRTSAIKRKCHLHFWFKVWKPHPPLPHIQVTKQSCVSSTRGSLQPSQNQPPCWWHHFWIFGPTLGLFCSCGKIGGRLLGQLPPEAPCETTPWSFLEKERKEKKTVGTQSIWWLV